MIPIYNYRTCIGHAKTISGAKRLIRKVLNVDPRMTINVYERDKDIGKLFDLPSGFVYSISCKKGR